ncbi:DUF6415 family natural product biosynthesis protein [Streptomyces chartreusis]|uniref:DUF6415 family natural product biosynthesis protein n=1 Tax=Streptomyces chartreusis TaxID=1969 RepID=UPI00342B0A63
MTAGPSAETQSDPIAELISEALNTTREYPPHDRLVELDKLLREEIDRLSTTARALAEQRPHRSRGWYALVNAVDVAEYALGFQLGTSPLAAGLHVSELARRVRELREVTAQ